MTATAIQKPKPVRIKMLRDMRIAEPGGLTCLDRTAGEEIDVDADTGVSLVRDGSAEWIGQPPSQDDRIAALRAAEAQAAAQLQGFQLESIEGPVLRFRNTFLTDQLKTMEGSFVGVVGESAYWDKVAGYEGFSKDKLPGYQPISEMTLADYVTQTPSEAIRLNVPAFCKALKTGINPGFRYSQLRDQAKGSLTCPTGHTLVLVVREASSYDGLYRTILTVKHYADAFPTIMAQMWMDELLKWSQRH